MQNKFNVRFTEEIKETPPPKPLNTRFKFRFWCVSEKRFVGNPEISKNGNVSCMDGISGSDDCSHDIIISQWTGMKDENGKDVYEGDVVKCDNGDLCAVIWDSEYGYWKVDYPIKDNGFDYDALSMNGGFCDENGTAKVVGNIYENPDLLK